jgi:CheY-like chemotaxis protein
LYSQVLDSRGHEVTIMRLGDRLQELYSKKPELPEGQHFDAVILDYKMPDRNGLEVAKEILTINPNQRIILASAYHCHKRTKRAY